MCSKRIYRDRYDFAYAINEIRINSGSQFDPIVADAFINYTIAYMDEVISEWFQEDFKLGQGWNSSKLGA